MRQGIRLLVVFAAGLMSLSPRASRGGIIWDSGVLHAQSSARYGFTSPGVSDNPPDVIMTSNTASHSTSSVIPVDASASATTDVTVGPTGVTVNASSDFFFHTGSSSSASVSGTVAFTKPDAEFMQPTFFASPNKGSGSLTIKNAANAIMLSYSSSSPPVNPSPILFAPGAYTMTWGWGTQPFVGTSGGSGMQFQLIQGPEPTSLALLAPATTLLLRRRRYRRPGG
jgi:hypothetical protein